jgi:pyruvate carboxylase
MEKLKTLLVANRGEIAVRIIRTAKALKLRTIAIYTKLKKLTVSFLAMDSSPRTQSLPVKWLLLEWSSQARIRNA